MANNAKHYHHGRTPAAWTGVAITLVGFVIGSVAFVLGPNWLLFWVGLAVILLGAVVGFAMSKMGLGQA